ncbi:transposase [Brumimicrobium oceani]|uniref:Transposase n=1 Tax=Brumimicrobium oceani TaxID=2100725 RepID=A0A2U2XFF8_9FLAO|nr:transposase [Brumimicrobium oceani]PWH86441.1 transposase [Brumimicrobium oceani]
MGNKKFRNGSFRLQSWDYRNDGAYFITINAAKHKHYFGEIINGKMCKNEIGEFAENFWLEIPNHFEHVQLENFVVMPNHTHGILILESCVRPSNSVGDTKPRNPKSAAKIKFGGKNENWNSGSVGVIINQYKRIVTINARKINPSFGWQPKFNDHIIRNSISFDRIQNYIKNNPQKWQDDVFNGKRKR